MPAVGRATRRHRRTSASNPRVRLLAGITALITSLGVITTVDRAIAAAGTTVAASTVAQTVTAAVTTPTTVSLAALRPTKVVGYYRVNRSVAGRRLLLDGTQYASGIGVRAYSRLTYDLAAGYATLSVRLGIDDEVGRGGSAVFVVYLDGRRAYASPELRGSSRARSVLLSVAGVRNLTLQVVSPDASQTSDHADWVRPTLVRVTPPAPSPSATPRPTSSPTPTGSPTVTSSPSPSATVTTTPTSPGPTSPSPTSPSPTSPGPTTPTPTVNCTTQVWQDLDGCGWAGPATTGHTSASLRTTAARTVTTDGTVIDGERISGGLVIAAKGVIVRNSWISKSAGGVNASAVVDVVPGGSLTIEHSTLDGQNATHACLWFEGTGGVTARYNEMYGCNDGIFSWDGDNFTLENNYLHGFTTQAANGHVDGFQTEGAVNGIIRHNTIDVVQDQTSAISIWNGRRSSNNILVDSNLLSGGGFTVYAEDYSPSEASPAGGYSVTNITISNNRFSTIHYGCVGYWGVWFPRGAPTDGWRRSGNKVLETGQAVDTGNPTYKGATCN